MSNELHCIGTSGQTVSAQLFSGAAAVGSTITCAEIGSYGIYAGSMPAVAAGKYIVVFYAGGQPIAAGSINWDGSLEIVLDDSMKVVKQCVLAS